MLSTIQKFLAIAPNSTHKTQLDKHRENVFVSSTNLKVSRIALKFFSVELNHTIESGKLSRKDFQLMHSNDKNILSFLWKGKSRS